MARNTTPIIIGAVLFGLLAIGLTFFVLNSSMSGGQPAPAPTTGPVVAQPTPSGTQYVAARTIYPRTALTAAMFIPSSNPKAGVANAVANPDDVVGRIANRVILKGDTLTSDAVTSPVARVIPANIPVPSGLRAVAIWVDPDQTAAGLVDVGDRVDVVVTHTLTTKDDTEWRTDGATESSHSRTIAQDVEVLAVDKSIRDYHEGPAPAPAPAPGVTPAPGAPADQAGATPAAPTPPAPTPPPAAANTPQFTRVILATTPEVAQHLIAGNQLGKLFITIRNPSNHDKQPIKEINEAPSRMVPTHAKEIARREKLADDRNAELRELRKSALDNASKENLERMKLPPMPINGGDIGSSTKEVTVIRGTEKTRVVVPR